MDRKCSRCQSVKFFAEYYKDKSKKDGYRYECIPCNKKRQKELNHNKTPEQKIKIRKSKQELYQKTKDHTKKIARLWYANNRQKVIQQKCQKIQNNALEKLKHQIRTLIKCYIKRKGYAKTAKTSQIVGCSYEELMSHLAKSAIKNYGKFFPKRNYHIDHIIPICVAQTEEELLKLNHYSNLQLLYPKDNWTKGDQLNWTVESKKEP